MSGYRTNTILCMPIKAIDGNIVGVIQAINKKDGTFSPTDEDVMAMLATQAGIALQNANLFRNAGELKLLTMLLFSPLCLCMDGSGKFERRSPLLSSSYCSQSYSGVHFCTCE